MPTDAKDRNFEISNTQNKAQSLSLPNQTALNLQGKYTPLLTTRSPRQTKAKDTDTYTSIVSILLSKCDKYSMWFELWSLKHHYTKTGSTVGNVFTSGISFCTPTCPVLSVLPSLLYNLVKKHISVKLKPKDSTIPGSTSVPWLPSDKRFLCTLQAIIEVRATPGTTHRICNIFGIDEDPSAKIAMFMMVVSLEPSVRRSLTVLKKIDSTNSIVDRPVTWPWTTGEEIFP